MKTRILTIVAVVPTLLAASASADVVNIMADVANSNAGLANYNGTLNYAFNGGNSGTLTVSLTNTTVAASGFITGFVFDIGSHAGGRTADLTSARPC